MAIPLVAYGLLENHHAYQWELCLDPCFHKQTIHEISIIFDGTLW